VLPASKAAPDRSVDRMIAERGWVDANHLTRLSGERRSPTVGRWVVAPAALEEAQGRVRVAVAAAGNLGLDVATLDERDRAVLDGLDDVAVAAGRARAVGDTDDPLAGHPYVRALEAAPFAPPMPAEAGVDRAELRELVRRGLVVEQDGMWFAPAAIASATAVIAQLLAAEPDGVTVAQVRDALGSSRKHTLPLLAHLDATGVTRRRGDVRIAGPRLERE
jgi:selenocysteine-specific elongation factor